MLALSGCGTDRATPADGSATCSTPVSLVDHMQWTLSDSDSPFSASPDGGPGGCPDGAPPDGASCPDAGPAVARCGPDDVRFEIFGEEPSLQVDTRFCNWVTLEQPAIAGAEQGEPRTVRLWYFMQATPAPATAVAALAFGNQMVWQDSLELPADRGGLLYDTTTWPVAIDRGDPIRFHLHNHGSNSWNLIELSALQPAPCGAGE